MMMYFPLSRIKPGGFEQEVRPTRSMHVGETNCFDCDGTGVFLVPDDEGTFCVACKGTGVLQVSI